MKKYISGICFMMFAASMSLTSCNQDAEGSIYEQSQLAVSFASTMQSEVVSADNNGVINVPVYRSNGNGEATVALTISGTGVEAGVLSLSSNDVKFAGGETIAYAVVKFDLSKVSANPEKKDEAKISFADSKVVSISGVPSIDIEVYKK